MSKTNTLDQLCDCAMQISASIQDRPTDWRGEQASLVFGKLCITCIGFLRFIPTSSFYAPASRLNVWDLSAAASLCRNLIEAYYVLVYVASNPADDEERQLRQALWEYHCAFERHEMLRVALPGSGKLGDVAQHLAQCKATLQQSSRFQTLSPGHQTKILEGDKFKLVSNIELSHMAGISENYYRAQYKYCSSFAHSSPFCISQLKVFIAGNPEAERVLGTLTDLAAGYTTFAIRDFVRLFPDLESGLSAQVRDSIILWQEIFKWEKLPWFKQAG